MGRWAVVDGDVTEFRRPRDVLILKRRHPSATGFIENLYSDSSKSDPVEQQALEMVFMQKVDAKASLAHTHLETHRTKPSDPIIRDAWARFLMSLMHRSPERVKYLTNKVRDYEANTLNPDLAERYEAIRGPDDPETYEEWLKRTGPITPELTVKLLRLLIDSNRIGETLVQMHWRVIELSNPRFGFLTGDHPITISNGLGHRRGFVALAISPTQLFLAAHDMKVINSFTSQRANGIEQAFNDACVCQSRHVIIGANDLQKTFVERRFLKQTAPVGQNGFTTWNAPLMDLRPALSA